MATETKILETKEELIGSVKEWIKMDNEIKEFQKEIKSRKNKQKLVSQTLMNVMKKNSIDCFDINGGSLVYKKTISKKPINAKTLLLTLQNYYKSTPNTAEELTKHILDSREDSVRETIKRKIEK